MTRKEIIEASEACMQDCCQACPLFTQWKDNCNEKLIEAIKELAGGTDIKCSDPQVRHEYGKGYVLQVTLQDEGKQAGMELADNYVGGYLVLQARRG